VSHRFRHELDRTLVLRDRGRGRLRLKGQTRNGTPTTETISTTAPEPAKSEDDGPIRTRIGWLKESWTRWISNSALGAAFGHLASKTIALPQLKRLAVGEIP
jgi:hypothetical protein